LDKLVEEGWLLNEGQDYTAAEQLRNTIKQEKARLNVPIDNHEWKSFAVIARRLPNKAVDIPNASRTPAIRTPLTRASKRRSLAVAVEAPTGWTSKGDGTQEDETIFVRDDGQPDKGSKKRRLRYSDPGVTSSETSSQRRKSTTTLSSQPSSRRKSTGASRTNRRHTMAVPPQPSPHMREIAQGVSREIQFIPLRQALSARTRRALRRNQLSEEMNDIDEERRAMQRKNKEELARVRAELAREKQLIGELQKQLQAARMAPPSETGSIGPGSVGMAPIYEDDAEEALSPPAFGSPSAPRTPFRFNMGSALTPALRRFQNENQREPGETPISRRDKRIKDLEGQIEQLRQDILDREEEERRRTEEEEIYHEAEEQILMEAMDTPQTGMVSVNPGDISVSEIREQSVTPRTTRSRARVSFAYEGEGFTPILPADSDDDDEFQAVTDDYSLDREVQGPSAPSPVTEVIQEAITVTTISAAPELEQENATLKAAIDVLKQRVEDLEGQLGGTKNRPEARISGVQTDPVTDPEKVKLKEVIEALEDKAEVLEQSSLEERNRLWQKIRGHISEAHNYEGVEELDMAIDEILTNLALAQNTADEHHKAFEAAERDLKVERMLAEEKATEITKLETERDSLLEQVEKLEEIKSDLEGQMADHEADEERLERELEDHKKELAAEQKELEMKSNELEAAVAEADKLERDLAELGDVIDEEIAEFPNAPRGPLTTILEKLQAYAEVVKEDRDTQQAKLEELMKSIAEKEDSLEVIKAQLASLMEKYDELEQINEKQQALLEKKDQEIEELKEELVSVKEQLEEAQEMNDMLNGVITSKNEKLTSLTDQLAWAMADLAKIKEKREEAQRQVAELSAELEKKNEEVRIQGVRLDLDLSGKAQIISSLEAQLASVTEQVSALNEKHTSKEQKVMELSNALTHMKEAAEAQLEELNTELDAKSGKIIELQEGMGTLTEQVVELRTTIEQLSSEQDSKEAKIGELKDQVKKKLETIAELETLNDVIQLKDKALEEMEARVTSLGTHLDEKNQLLAAAAADLAALRVELGSNDESIVTLGAEIVSLNERLANLEQQHENELSATLADKNGMMNELSEEINEVNNTIAEKSHQVEDLKSEISSLEGFAEVREEQIRALQAQIEDLNNRLESYAAKIQKLEGNVAMLQGTNEQKEHSIQEFNGTIANLNRTIAERDDAIATLNRDVADRNGVIQVNAGVIKTLIGKADDLARVAQEKEELINALNEDIIELNEQISSLNDDLSLIQDQRDTADDKIKELMENVAQKDERISELEKLYDVIAVKNTEIDSLNDTIDNLRTQLTNLNERYAAAEARIEELVQEVAKKQRTITQLEADLDLSILRETETNKRYTEAITMQDTLKGELERMHSAVGDLKAAVNEREATLNEKDEAITALQQKCTDLETRMREQIGNHSEQLKALRTQIELERDNTVNDLHLKLEEALGSKAELEVDLQATMSEYKETVAELESKVEGLEGEMEGLKGKNEQTSAEMGKLEEAKDAIIAGLERRVMEVVQAKARSEAELETQIEQKKMALAEKEKELVDIELTAQKEKHTMRIELNKQYEEISRLEEKITELEVQLEESVEEENRLEEEIQEYEQSTQLLKEDAAKIKAALESNNQELAKEIDALRLELLRARDELKHEIELHANNTEENDSKIARLAGIIDNYKEEGVLLKKRISALNVTNEKLRQKYNRAIEDSTAEFDTIQNNLWKVASGVKERKSQFLQRSTARMLAQEGEGEDEQDQLQIEGTHESTSTAGGLMSPDATTNVSFMSPPTPESTQNFVPLPSRIMSLTTHAGKKRRFDSGIGAEEEEDEVTRFEEYGSQRRGFLAEGH